MTEDNQQEKTEQERLSRRRFIKNSGYAVGGLAAGGVIGSVIPWRKNTENNNQQKAGKETDGVKNYNRALMNFTKAEFAVVEDASERIFPKDDKGPGAVDLGVPFYIDHQLAGSYGFNARDYMEPPFFHGEAEQGYQGRLKRREIFKIGIRELQNYSHQQYDKEFTKLSEDEQIQVLQDFEEDKVKLATISTSGFFDLLRSMTLEGLYSDPLYGGNINMDGWRMKEYPGNVMSYKDIIEKDFQEIEPESLQDHM